MIILYKHSKQGDNFMFANYKALGQTEPVDQVDFMHWFLNKSPYVDNVDKTRVACYGWSYGLVEYDLKLIILILFYDEKL